MVQEVNTLAAQAQRLHDDGRLVEADAVAALAEWRARAIEQAAADPGEAATASVAALDSALPDESALEVPADELPDAVAIKENVDTSTPPEAPETEVVASVAENTAPRTLTHKVARGESASVIAGKYGVGLSQLLEWNNLTRRSVLNIGDELTIHLAGEAGVETAAAPAPPTPEAAPETLPAPEKPESAGPARRTHKVARGDNPSSIAKTYGIALADLMEWNKLTRRSTLRVGDTLIVELGPDAPVEAVADEATPAEAAPAEAVPVEAAPESLVAPIPTPTPATQELTHTVARGENPSIIANKYGVVLDDLLQWNNLTRRSTLSIGDTLVVRGGAAPDAGEAAADGQRKVTHTVVRGDNPSVIANKYDVALEDFLEWNSLSTRSVLHLGEKYVVYLPAP
jgi:membrane-bound lytic murein transglycosylase D